MKKLLGGSRSITKFGLAALLVWAALPVSARVLDDFNDNTKTAWQDFTFVPGFGLPQETGGQFKFTLPPAGQSIFTGSVKTSEKFTVQDGRTVEFRVDMVSGYGGDSFAVLFALPEGQSIGTLTGYGLAKSSTDILITKGINKYFVNQAIALKNDNITLVMSLTGKGASVIINAKVLDKDANDAVIWERTVVDTAGADVLEDGTDSPAAAFQGQFNYGLLCYEDNGRSQDYYEVVFDNAERLVLQSTVMDDFNDNTKTAWEDFTFVPGFGVPEETGGQFKFFLVPVKQRIFSGSLKLTRVFDLVDGERVEFRVDLVSGYGGDSFAVLFALPEGQSINYLTGYGLAKSSTDILITKGIDKYFFNEAIALKNDNVTLVLSLTGKGTSVIINAKVLDKDANDAVLWEWTAVDTAEADILADGTDSPAAAFLGKLKLGLLCYEDDGRSQDYYQVIYDNLVALAQPVAANVAPIIAEVSPDDGANFLPTSTRISFKVTDDKAVPAGGLSVDLNGVTYTTASGLQVTGSGTTVTASLGGLAANVNYTALIRATDSQAATTTALIYFDTFSSDLFVIEVEDYNLGSGGYFTQPVPIPEGWGPQDNAYAGQVGVADVDFKDNRATPNLADTPYRPDDPVRMQRSLDIERQKFRAAGGKPAGVYDYDVGDNAVGDWLNYTRNFPVGSYQVYLREAVVNMDLGECVLEQVTSDPRVPDQTVKVLGSFLGKRSGFTYRNVLLTGGTGKNPAIVRLSAGMTLRLRQVTPDPGDGMRFQNYLVLRPVADPGVQRAAVTAVSPADGATVETVTPVLSATIQNRDTSVNLTTVALQVKGHPVTPTVQAAADGATVTYALSPLPPPNTAITVRLSFKDNLGADVDTWWTFTVTYKALDPANRRAGPGLERGFKVRVVQAPFGTPDLGNTLERAERQLALDPAIPVFLDTNVVMQVINQAQDPRASGYFPDEDIVPGIDEFGNGTDDFAVEILACLELTTGVHRFGVVTDDGYKIASGKDFKDAGAQLLGFHNGGPANETFDFVVPASGFYPFRMMWYERGGNAYAEWFSVDLATGERTLINDPAAAKAVKAWVWVAAAPTVKVEFTARLGEAFAQDTTAVIDTAAKTITIPMPAGNRFYRINAGVSTKIVTIRVEGANLVLNYQ